MFKVITDNSQTRQYLVGEYETVTEALLAMYDTDTSVDVRVEEEDGTIIASINGEPKPEMNT